MELASQEEQVNWKENFYAALLRFLQTELNHPEATRIESFGQRMVPGFRYSEYTGDLDHAVIEITFDGWQVAEWKGDFAELLEALTWTEGTPRE